MNEWFKLTLETLPSVIIGVVAIFVTTKYNNHSRRLANEKMQRGLFKEFNERYDKLNSSLSEIKRLYPDDIDYELRQSHVDDIMDFFNLCAEEYYWKDRLGERIWISWHDGMNYWYQNVPLIKRMWDDELDKLGHKAYYLKEGDSFFKNKSK